MIIDRQCLYPNSFKTFSRATCALCICVVILIAVIGVGGYTVQSKDREGKLPLVNEGTATIAAKLCLGVLETDLYIPLEMFGPIKELKSSLKREKYTETNIEKKETALPLHNYM